jgi:hypothetical protein
MGSYDMARVDPSVVQSILESKTDSPEKTVAFMEAIFMQGDSRLWPLRRTAFESILYMVGEQNLYYNPSIRRWIARRPEVDYLTYPSINLVLPAVETAYAQFMKSEPVATVVPNSTDEEDRQGARVADKIRVFKNWEDRMDAKVRRIVMQMICSGDVFAFNYIGASRLKTITVPKMRSKPTLITENGDPIDTEQLLAGAYQGPPPLMGQNADPVIQMVESQDTDPETGEPLTQEIPMTDVATDVWSMFETIMDFDAENFEDIRWAASRRVRSVDWIGETFGAKVEQKVKSAPQNLMPMTLQWKFTELLTRGVEGGFGLGVSSKFQMEHACVVKTFIERPNIRSKKGRLIMTAGSVVIYQDVNPWHLTEDPQQLGLVQFGYSPLLNTPWHFGLPKNIIDLNRRVRGIHAALMHHRRTMGFGQWLVPKGSAMLTDRMTGKPGLILSYDPRKTGGHVPQRIPGVEPAQMVIFELKACEDLIKEISGTNQVLSGEQPFAGMPGVSLNLLAEKAAGRFVFARQGFEDSLSQLDCQRLELVPLTRRWNTQQIVKIVGRSGEVDVESYSQTDMAGNLDVRYEIGTKKASSHAAHQQNLLDLVKLGLIDIMNPTNRMLLREEFGASQFMDVESPDYKMARWENMQMRRGKPVQLNLFENSEIHLQVHTEEMKQPEFLKQQPEVMQMFFQHVIMTAQRVQAIEQEAAMQAVGDEPGNGKGGGVQGPQPGGNGSSGAAAKGGSEAPMSPADPAQQAQQQGQQ